MDRRRRFTIGFEGTLAVETLARRAGLQDPMLWYRDGFPCIQHWQPSYVRNDGLIEEGYWTEVRFASDETMVRHLMGRALMIETGK